MTLDNGLPVVVTGKDEPYLVLGVMPVLMELPIDVSTDKQSVIASVIHTVHLDKQTSEVLMQSTTQDISECTQPARLQVGLTTKASQHELVKEVAQKRGVSVSVAARDLLQDGLSRFEYESMTVSPAALLTDYENKAHGYDGAESENWIIRADRYLVMKTRLRAGEYQRSVSSFANLILANALSHCTVAASVFVKNTHSIITDEDVVIAVQVIEQVSGTKARDLALQIDLGKQRVLTNMILGGTVLAPARVIAKLAAVLKLRIDVLLVALERRFAAQAVPSFKATNGKPTVQSERKSWAVAVSELQLPADEQERLLNLEG